MNRVGVSVLLVGLLAFSNSVHASPKQQWQSDSLTKSEVSIELFERTFSENKQAYASIEERMKLYRVPGVSIATVSKGKLAWLKSYGVKQTGSPDKIDVDTVFSVGSISKVVTATVTLLLVQQGKLNLDADINEYVSNWQVPTVEGLKSNSVSLRQLMSHTAGFNVHGFRDFQPSEALPNTLDILLGRAPAKNQPVKVIYKPGVAFSYSGGGTTVQQLVIEQVTGKPFVQVARQLLFGSLNMSRSTFVNPLPASHLNIAKAHDRYGNATALPRGWESMPEKAASGLWTSANDLAKLMLMFISAFNANDGALIGEDLIQDMMSAEPNSRYGLGPAIADPVFYHSGANDSYRALFQGNLKTGNGFIILTNSASGEHFIEQVKKVMLTLGVG